VAAVAARFVFISLQQDFAAYFTAGRARSLGLDPYVNHAGLPGPAPWDGVAAFAYSRFLYPPVVAEICRPWAALPYRAAKALFTALALACWAGASVLAARAFDRGRPGGVAIALGAGALYFPLYAHLERGQADLPALLLLVAAWSWRGRPAAAGGA